MKSKKAWDDPKYKAWDDPKYIPVQSNSVTFMRRRIASWLKKIKIYCQDRFSLTFP